MIDDEGAGPVRARLDHLADTAPPLHFTAGDVVRRGRRRRQVRRGALLAGAAAGLALVVAVPTVALRPDGGGTRAAGPGPAATTTPTATTPTATSPSRTAPPGDAPVRLTVPGLTAAQADQIARSCAQSAAYDARQQREARVYNLVRDAVGTHALVFTSDSYLSCDVSGSPAHYSAQAGSAGVIVREWLPGPFGIDASSGADGGTPQKDRPGAPPAPGYVLTEGRVTSAVARLTVSFGADRLEVRPRNGTFLARQVFPTTWRPEGTEVLAVTAYDARGRLLGSYRQVGPEPCYQTPSGQVILGRTATPSPGCKPAQRWR